MKVWVEDSAVEDINGKLFKREPENGKETARGWLAVGGAAKAVIGADLLKRIYVSWQSVVESQVSGLGKCAQRGERVDAAVDLTNVVRKLRPAIALLFWVRLQGSCPVRDSCHRHIKMIRIQVEIEPLDSNQGKSQWGCAHPISEESKPYIDDYDVPFGGW